jgi:hypothetical protein
VSGRYDALAMGGGDLQLCKQGHDLQLPYLLKNWRILRKLRCCPWRAGQLAKAIHALEINAA